MFISIALASCPCERADFRLGWCHVPEDKSGAYLTLWAAVVATPEAALLLVRSSAHEIAPCRFDNVRPVAWCRRMQCLRSARRGRSSSEKYQADVETCRTASTETVRLKNAATPGKWIISPITGPPAVRAAIRTCMESKGYALQKTAIECRYPQSRPWCPLGRDAPPRRKTTALRAKRIHSFPCFRGSPCVPSVLRVKRLRRAVPYLDMRGPDA